jgi:hypothetical protein
MPNGSVLFTLQTGLSVTFDGQDVSADGVEIAKASDGSWLLRVSANGRTTEYTKAGINDLSVAAAAAADAERERTQQAIARYFATDEMHCDD